MGSLRDRARMKSIRQRKNEHYNTKGSWDAFSELIDRRLRVMKITRAEFARRIPCFPIRTPYQSSTPKRTITPSLITRILQGRRSLPMGDVLPWIYALDMGTPKQLREFSVIVALANALRDIRRKLPVDHVTRKELEPLIDTALTQQVRNFRWGDDRENPLPKGWKPTR